MKEALKLALEALMNNEHYVAENERHAYVMLYNEVIEKCKAALAQPAQRPWVGLTPDERYECIHGESVDAWDIAEAVEAKLKELNI